MTLMRHKKKIKKLIQMFKERDFISIRLLFGILGVIFALALGYILYPKIFQ